jgi:predicted AlkP superfamily phosphohydrolase/phosphomutase
MSSPRVVAIGIDAADARLVRALADRGDMPTLRKLFDEGTSGVVISPSDIASTAVWPTFLSATSLWEHEKYSYWSWDPQRMRIDVERLDGLRPFWRAPLLADRRVGVFDVPCAPPPTPLHGFEIAGWGAQDFSVGAPRVWPPALVSRVRRIGGRHPIPRVFDSSPWAWMPGDFLERCVDGVRRRGRLIAHLLAEESPELFVTVFSETHIASHFLWHTAQSAQGPGPAPPPHGPGLVDLFRELDRQIGSVLTQAGAETAVLVFSLNGMRSGRGIPLLLDPLLRSVGLAAWTPEPGLQTLRRWAPTPLKRLYQRLVPTVMKMSVARLGLIPRYDWSRTMAFPLPTVQHGCVRVNLEGREAAGIVAPGAYDRVCREIERLLIGLEMEDGTPVVERVLRTSLNSPAGLAGRLPDLVVHWAPAATAKPFRLRAPAIRCELGATRITGEHVADGFWIFRSPRPGGPANAAAIATEALGPLLIDQLR